MFKFFSSKKKDEGETQMVDMLADARGWYSNRYYSVVVQRNILFLFVILSLCAIAFSAIAVFKISKSRTIEPFVVEIEKKSGITTLVNPVTVKQYSSDEVLNNYFIVEYIRARELFDPNNFQYNYSVKTRLFSSQDVYNEFRGWISLRNTNSPLNIYSNVTSGNLKLRSLQHLRPGNAQVRFTLEFNQKNGVVLRKDRIATLTFQYISLEMDEQQRQVNPLGFQITYYRADDEFL